MYDIRIVAILTANDDGSQAATATPAGIAHSVSVANEAYNPHGVNFLFDPATDVLRVNDDHLNRDCARRDHELYTDENADPANLPAMDGLLYNNRRNEVARRFPGRVVVFFTAGSRYRWVAEEGRWVYAPRNYSWSNYFDEFVTMAEWAGGDTLAHEVGHYLHLGHTHYALPESAAAAAERIRAWVDDEGHAKAGVPEELFSGDGIADTPPDPGPDVFNNQCDPNESSATIAVTFADKSQQSYVFTPDRENVMSYWNKTCRGKKPRLTNGQGVRIRSALEQGNRHHLVEPALFHYGVWEPGDRSQTRALTWAIHDFARRFDAEIGLGRRCVHMRAYNIGDGQIRYDGVWERNANAGQTRAIAWALQDFAARFDQEIAAGRACSHLQAYDIGGGQVRYDGVWDNGGSNGQTRALAWALNDFAARFNAELAAGRRCVHMQAYDVGGGQIRYDGIWSTEPGGSQTRALAWALNDFAKRFDAELAAGRRCVHVQAYDIGGGQIRYDGVWESGGSQGQTRALAWAFNDFVRRCDGEAAAGRRLVHMQAYDLGGGQVRYDGVWQTGAPGQQRAFGLTLGAFADRFDELTSSQYHLTLMTTCSRMYAGSTVGTRAATLAAHEVPVGVPGSDLTGKRPSLTRSGQTVHSDLGQHVLCRLGASGERAPGEQGQKVG